MNHNLWMYLVSLLLAAGCQAVSHEDMDPAYAIEKSDILGFEESGIRGSVPGSRQIGGQQLLQDWIPVQASLGANDSLTYTFHVNYSSPGLSSSYEIMVFISASICKLPEAEGPNDGLTIYYTFDQTATNISSMNQISFENGYAQGIASVDTANDTENLYITVKADECSECSVGDTWVYELGLSQSDLVFQYDINSMVSVLDTDYDSAALSAKNLTFRNDSNYKLYIYDEDLYSPVQRLNESWCAVKESTGYVQEFDLIESSIVGDGKFFSVGELNKSSTYTAVLVQSYNTLSYGGAVFHPFNFSTMGSEACKVIYGLDFCDQVSYAVPVSRNFSMGSQTAQELGAAYDNYVQDLYQNFDYAMQQISCDAHLDSRYSPIRTCDDCKYSYKQWLCAVSIPRCSSENSKYYREYSSSDGRNSFVKDTIDPPLAYSEILPCIDMCDSIVRDCPADFGFTCPLQSDFAGISYGVPNQLDDFTVCNSVGDQTQDIGDFSVLSNDGMKLTVGSTALVVWAVFSITFIAF
ncbi:DEKNAAC102351 [Brettanomyces naardenensis]|uniref:DEKNAAC102351 n=1 Tax=Brettanomyces naardenensis TaxID=13370 RepID=A0A448YKL5_BRENA|nr:DEKNAAC102351 [Brettanomyces naardenensis]